MISKVTAKKWYRVILMIALGLTTMQLLGCGSDHTTGSDRSSSDTGIYSFTLAWPDGTHMNATGSTVPRAVDCAATGIETIVAAFYNNTEQLLKNPPDEFECIDHNGRVRGLPPGSNYRILVTGEDASGKVLYQGEQTEISIVAGQTTPGEEIPMFLVTAPSCTDNDSDFYFVESGCGTALDCDDSDENVNPGATEVCDDDTDNNCDGDTDCDDADCAEDAFCVTPTCTDSDSDLYFKESGCGTALDCDDSNGNINPGAAEVCGDGADNDCDGNTDCVDEDCSDYYACNYTNSLGMSFKLLPPGTFSMGSPIGEFGRESLEISHQVTLTQPFYIQTTEVTQGQWESIMGSNPASDTACGSNCPVETVSWNDVQIFISAINNMGEGTYRLPTEAEWEYAARAGSTSALPNGNITVTDCDYDPNLDVIGWYCYNSSSSIHPVAQKPANDWGLFDMHGNVLEWVQDWYEDYPSVSVIDPTGPINGVFKVNRGGSWTDIVKHCRSARRNATTPQSIILNQGLRLVVEPNEIAIKVPDNYATIQEAIDAAATGDTVMVADGTYLTPGPDGIDFSGKAITVRSQNGPENCTINAGGTGRGFYFHNSEQATSVLSGFTITNGVIDGWSTGGGGILCDGASPTIKNCTIKNNRAEAIAWGGGGISCVDSASPTIVNCVIDSNSSVDADGGGGIYCDNASPIIRNCTIVNNSAGTDSGGGIYIFGPSSTTIINSIFWNNTPGQIDSSSASPNVTYSDIEGDLTGTGNINSDPNFAGAGVYSLATGSPCIDTGTASGAPDSDITGVTRPQGSGYDMGAYEYQ